MWKWSLAGLLVLLLGLSVAGFARPDPQAALIRGALVLATLLLIGEMVAEVSSPALISWYAALSVLYPLVLPARQARISPVLVAAVFFAVAYLGSARLGVTEAGLRAVTLFAGGVAAFIVGHVVLELRVERDRMAGRLRSAEVAFDAAFESSPSGLAILDPKGNFRQVNRALAEFLGMEADDVLQSSWQAVVHPDDLPRQAEEMRRLVEGDAPSFQTETRFRLRGGRISFGMIGMSAVSEPASPPYLFVHVTNINDRVRSESRLRKSVAHFRSLFDFSPVPVWEVDLNDLQGLVLAWRRQGITDPGARVSEDAEAAVQATGLIRVRNVNEAARSLFGASTTDEFAAGLAQGRLGDGHHGLLGALMDAAMASYESHEMPLRLEDFLGGTHVGTVRVVVPRVDGNPDISGVQIAFVDATERKETETALQRIEERLRTVVSGAPVVLFAIDPEGIFTLSEGQALAALGLAPGEVVGRSAFEMYRGSPTVAGHLRRALGGEAFTTIDEVGELVFETRYSPMWEDGEVGGVIGVAFDITSRVRTSERLQALVRSKDEFVATVSHELRTPLTAVVGFTQELEENLAGLSSEDVESFVRLIGEQALEVSDLVDDLLVASRIEHGEVSISAGEINLWHEVDAVLRARRLTSEVIVERAGEVKVVADPIRVRQIFRNLITNADRYGGPRVTVTAERGEEEWRLTVADDGSGIPEPRRSAVFEPYQRAHDAPGRTESVGLGLTVSRRLARLMEGDLTYAHDGERSSFSLSLPAA